MENIIAAIAETESQIEALQNERESADITEYAKFDMDIMRMKLRSRQLRAALELQEKKESEAQEDLDICTKAGLFVADIVNQVSEDGGDFNTDTRLIAAYRLSNVIDRLEVLRMYSDFLGNEAFPDYNSFTAPFDHFVNEYNENVENVRARLKEIDMEIERLKAALEDATNAGNTEEIISYTDALEISKKSKEYLLPALKKQEGKDALPNGAVKDAWADVCNLYYKEYEMRLEIIRAAREIYDNACNELVLFDDQLKQARWYMQTFAKEHSRHPDQITEYNYHISGNMDIAWLKAPEVNGEKAWKKIHFNKSTLL